MATELFGGTKNQHLNADSSTKEENKTQPFLSPPLPLAAAPPTTVEFEKKLIQALESDNVDAVFGLFGNDAKSILNWKSVDGEASVWDWAALSAASWSTIAKLAALAPPSVLENSGFWERLSVSRAFEERELIRHFLQQQQQQHSESVNNEINFANSSMTAASGYLYKWTNYATGWKKRFFALSGPVLSYYKSQNEWPAKPKASMLIGNGNSSISVQRPHSGTDACAFTLVGGGGRTRHIGSYFYHSATAPPPSFKLHLRACTPQEALQWTMALENAISQASSVDGSLRNQNFQSCIPPIPVSNEDSLCKRIKDSLQILHQLSGIPPLEKSHLQETLQLALQQINHPNNHPNNQTNNQLNGHSTDEEEQQPSRRHFQASSSPEDSSESGDEFFDVHLPPPPESSLASPGPHLLWARLKEDYKDCNLQSGGRRFLPFKSTDIPKVSLWSFLKGVIGKDLTRLPVPVNYLEPLSMLQRMAEEMEHCGLLFEAARCQEGSWKRLELVAAFAVSGYASTECRLTKPFNPLLGETFEMCGDASSGCRGCSTSNDPNSSNSSSNDSSNSSCLDWRYFSEQVSHHPPVSAFHAESQYFCYWGESVMKSRFRGKYLEVTPDGICHLYLIPFKEHYTWKKVNSCVQNILFGTMTIEHSGVMHVANRSNGESCLIEFGSSSGSSLLKGSSSGSSLSSSSSSASSSSNRESSSSPQFTPKKRLEGHVLSSQGSIIDTLQGYWNGYLRAERGGMLWEVAHGNRNSDFYHFTPFTMLLNQPIAGACPTDSRYRPDQRALEHGEIGKAQKMKAVLEANQRERRKHGCDVQPRWFVCDGGGGTLSLAPVGDSGASPHWAYGGGYWAYREEAVEGGGGAEGWGEEGRQLMMIEEV